MHVKAQADEEELVGVHACLSAHVQGQAADRHVLCVAPQFIFGYGVGGEYPLASSSAVSASPAP